MNKELDREDSFVKEFNLKLPEHIHYIRGYLDAINRLILRNDYKHLFWIKLFDYPADSKIDFLNAELDVSIEKIEPLNKFIGIIERNTKEHLYKYFLGEEYDKNSDAVSFAIELLTWDVAEYIDWLEFFSYSCIVEKGTLKQSNDDKGEIYCFSLNQKYLVVLGIVESKIVYPSNLGVIE